MTSTEAIASCGGDKQRLFAANTAAEIDDIAAEGLHFVIALAKHDPFVTGILTILRFLPAHYDSAFRAVDLDVVFQFFVDAPRKINAA